MRIWLVACLFLALALPVKANDEAKLEALKKEIAKLQGWLNEAQKESGELTEALKKSDKDISAQLQHIETIRQKIHAEQERLKKLRQEQGQLREKQHQQRVQLQEQLRAAHKIGQDGSLKLMLNQDDPQQAQRMLQFFAYFNQARISKIKEIMAELERLEQIASLIQKAEDDLKQSRQEQLQVQRTLTQTKAKQQQLLARLTQSMRSSEQQLVEKEASRRQLETLIKEVQTLLDSGPRSTDARPIRSLKGALPTPVAGRVIQRFGSPIAHTSSRLSGWLIATNEGADVRAIHHGRVIYADWLRGYGLIMLIDHGQGYLSLYAHNQSLLRTVGNWVNQGDVIASAGRSGGAQHSGLYFEIRYQGRPQNPAHWLRH